MPGGARSIILLACVVGAACSAGELRGLARAERGTPTPASGNAAMLPPAPTVSRVLLAAAPAPVALAAAEPAPEALHEATPEYAESLDQFNQHIYPFVVGGKGTAQEALDATEKDWTATFQEDGKI